VLLDNPIKTLGLSTVRVMLHPEVVLTVTLNVARSPEEAERQARGEAVTGEAAEEGVSIEELLEPGAEPEPAAP
jgi:large subunit ribosomal protein L9